MIPKGGNVVATSSEIQVCLSTIKSVHSIRIIPTEKNRETRFQLGITVDDQVDLIRNLTLADYIAGPEADYDSSRSGDIWKFKKNAYGTTFYIKVKIEHSTEIRAISCHIDNIII